MTQAAKASEPLGCGLRLSLRSCLRAWPRRLRGWADRLVRRRRSRRWLVVPSRALHELLDGDSGNRRGGDEVDHRLRLADVGGLDVEAGLLERAEELLDDPAHGGTSRPRRCASAEVAPPHEWSAAASASACRHRPAARSRAPRPASQPTSRADLGSAPCRAGAARPAQSAPQARRCGPVRPGAAGTCTLTRPCSGWPSM